MTTFRLTDSFLEIVSKHIQEQNDTPLLALFEGVHYADVAEVVEELSLSQATYLIKLLDSDLTSDVLAEIDEDTREDILKRLSVKEIANELQELDTDDAADIIGELSNETAEQVISAIPDKEHAEDIRELSTYQEDTAGGLMAKELVKVYDTWTVAGCLRKIRAQAKNVRRVHSIYVTNKKEQLIGRLSLKDLITAKNDQKILDIYINKVDSVSAQMDVEEVAKVMAKYDLEAIPVVDEQNILLGRITIDDIVDVIKEEAEKDYQLAAGITQDVEADDTVFELVKARLPWLVLGLFGGLGSVFIMQGFEAALENYAQLFFFTPLIAAMAGNVGVQSSAIIVQGLANDVVKGSMLHRLLKEVGLSLISGVVLGLLVILFSLFYPHLSLVEGCIIALSMLCVIIVAALIGTFVPIVLDKNSIDPAIATGPFITTSNDIFGIFLFFFIAEQMLGGF
ncbi:MAG: magnesium transporter [Flavobacteriaceae bacterium]|nr:magnesium transporter [Flavobacteriaceae bacterium]